MIVFNLKCAEGHGFEEWFASSADYDAKVAARALVCPECGSTHIEKGLSAPRINGGAQAPAPAAAGPCGLPACAGGVCQMANWPALLPSGAHADHGTVLKPSEAALVVGGDGKFRLLMP